VFEVTQHFSISWLCAMPHSTWSWYWAMRHSAENFHFKPDGFKQQSNKKSFISENVLKIGALKSNLKVVKCSLSAVLHRISPQILNKIRKYFMSWISGLGGVIDEKHERSKISCHGPFIWFLINIQILYLNCLKSQTWSRPKHVWEGKFRHPHRSIEKSVINIDRDAQSTWMAAFSGPYKFRACVTLGFF
jgi:hypothetical protein